jgi:uncharacterized membrane protein
MDATILLHWAEFAIRWLHVITAIAWIGSSFYFIALDLGLNRNIPGPADGEEWQVHGGGFYHIQKYMVAPEAMPEHLTWFKWESYATWLSGVALLILLYWVGAELYLIDWRVMELAPWQAIVISALSLTLGWVAYDLLCKSKLGENPTLLMLLLFGIIVVLAWGYTQVFSGRAALLHLGALTATIMTANVAMIIIPNQKIVVADLKAGRTPDPKYGKIAKLRSTHNNYLTLPVIFLMLSNHYPLAFASEWNWLIASLVFLMGVTIRHFFNTMHAKGGYKWWTWGATAAIFAVIMWLSILPLMREEPGGGGRADPAGGTLRRACGLSGRGQRRHRQLQLLPRHRGHLSRPRRRAGGHDPRQRCRDCHPCDGHLPSGRRQPRHAAGRRGRAVGGRPRADPDVVSRGDGRRALRSSLGGDKRDMAAPENTLKTALGAGRVLKGPG